MKSSNKLLVKIFSVVIIVMLLNVQNIFASRFYEVPYGEKYTDLTGGENYSEEGNGGYYLVSGGTLYVRRSNNSNSSFSIKFSSNTAQRGGAIYQSSGLTDIIASDTIFSYNSATKNGGAIGCLNGSLSVGENAKFIGNKAGSSGGAIYCSGSLYISENAIFDSNEAKGTTSTYGCGGALLTDNGPLIESDFKFTNNTAKDFGGAICHLDSEYDYFRDFYIMSSAESQSKFENNKAGASGGAIYNEGAAMIIYESTIFYGNKASSTTVNVGKGGAIYNNDNSVWTVRSQDGSSHKAKITIGDNVLFEANTATSDGGAIYNAGEMAVAKNVWLLCNESNGDGGAIYNSDNKGKSTIGSGIYFYQNKAKNLHSGGAVYNNGILTIQGDATFEDNNADGNGGAICNNNGTITIGENASFTDNSSGNDGGAIYNRLGTIIMGSNATFADNTSNFAGAIYNDEGTITFTDGAIFENNVGTRGYGSIYNYRGEVNLIADNYDVLFTITNKAISAIESTIGTTNLWVSKNANIIFDNKITSNDNISTLNINKSSGTLPTTGEIILNADMSGYRGTINFYNGTIKIGENGKWFGGNLTVSNSPTIDTANSIINAHNFNNLTVNNSLNLIVDANLENTEMDTISATSFGNSSGKIKVKGINILSDVEEVGEWVTITFANDVLKDKVESIKKAKSALYNYDVAYDKETGCFRFTNMGEGGGEINFGTAASAIAATAGGAATQSLVANQVFANMNGKTSSGKKASIDPSNLYVSAGDQVFDNSGKIERGLWLKPFMAQETVKIGDADVDNNLYGTLAGIDFPVGEDKQVSFYLGYAGSKQEIEDVKSNQTGYVLGATGMVMKDSWYAGLTANVMFNKASIDTDFGTDDVDMNMFSVAAKAGYNFNITNSFVLEPNLTLVYGVVNSQEYETSQGAQIDSQSISNISVEPQVKAKFEIGNGWQPYGLLGYSANLGSKPTVKTDGVELELDSIDGYVEYGAGVNKDFIGTVWSCYAQVTGRSGGRNGFVGNLGIKYKF